MSHNNHIDDFMNIYIWFNSAKSSYSISISSVDYLSHEFYVASLAKQRIWHALLILYQTIGVWNYSEDFYSVIPFKDIYKLPRA